MGVRSHAWGQGIGSILVDTLIDWARSGGVIRKINLTVRVDNERGLALYRRRGFVVEGTRVGDVCVDGVDMDLHCMGLQLSST